MKCWYSRQFGSFGFQEFLYVCFLIVGMKVEIGLPQKPPTPKAAKENKVKQSIIQKMCISNIKYSEKKTIEY